MTSDLVRRVERLSPEQRALLEQRLLERRRQASGDVIPRRDPAQPLPPSFSQERLLFLDEWSPGAPTYNAALPMRIRGALDVEALRSALEGVVERHEALRTVFPLEPGERRQHVLDEWSFGLTVLDLRHVSPEAREDGVGRILRERARRPFDLTADLMLRATLLRLDEAEHILQLEEHHIAFDGWSDGILFGELQELYDAHRNGREPDLPELPIQYADFALWQRRRMQGELLEAHVAYWRAQLAGAPTVLRLRTDFPRPRVQAFEGARRYLTLPHELASGVRELSQELGTTPYMTLLAVFATLLYRVTGADDILIGSPIANRNRVELEGLIGFFSNTLVLRIRLGGNPTFRELARRVREVALGAYAHQDLPFEKIVEVTRPTRTSAVNPLFQVNFRVQSGAGAALALSGVELEPLRIDVGLSRFDLALELHLENDAMGGYLEYNTQLFAPETADRFSQGFQELLEDVLARPDTALLELNRASATDGPAAAPRTRHIQARRRRLPKNTTGG